MNILILNVKKGVGKIQDFTHDLQVHYNTSKNEEENIFLL